MGKTEKVTFDIIRAKSGWKGKDLLLIAIPDESWDDPYFIADSYYPFSRVVFYLTYELNPWREDDFDLFITDIGFIQRPGVDYRTNCVLSLEGDFIIRENGEKTIEKIPGAGIEGENSGRGRLFGMTIINNHVYAYGEARQLYRRSDDGIWTMLDENIYQPIEIVSFQNIAIIFDVKGLREDAIYIVDTAGCINFWNGTTMRLIEQVEGISLVSILIEDEDTIWICGNRGTLLRGNAKSGFTRMPGVKGTHNFVSMAKFKDKIYLASHGGGRDVGAYVYENNTLTKLVTGLTPETQYDAHTVTCTDEDLWIVGLKDILHFDGSAWERIDFPGNPPIR